MASTDTTITFYGFWHLTGLTVRATILGLDCGTYVVDATGSIVVPYASDVGGLLTPAYVVANTNTLTGVEQNLSFNVTVNSVTTLVMVPVVIGLDYTTQGQLLRPDNQADIKSQFGPGLGKTRRVHMLAAFVQDAITTSAGSGLAFGTDFDTNSTMFPAQITSDGQPTTVRAEDAPFTGIYWGPIEDSPSFEGQVAWQVNRPYPCTICSITAWLDVTER